MNKFEDKSQVLPDSRSRDSKGVIRGPMRKWLPIFSASCGADGGMVPEENMTFVFWLCRSCAETYGKIANMMMMPDEAFWERVKQEQLETHKRLLTEQELLTVVEADASPLATLLKQGR